MELRKEVLEFNFRTAKFGFGVLELVVDQERQEKSAEKSQSSKRKNPEDYAIETGLCSCTTYCEKCRKRDIIRAWYSRKQEALKKHSKDFELEEPKKKKSKISIKAYKERKQEALNKDPNDFEVEEPEKKKSKISEDDLDDDLNSWTCQIELYL